MSFYNEILTPVFGDKPQVAKYKPTEFTVEQPKAIQENVAAFPDITKLGDLYQQYMLADLNRTIPGFSDILASGGKTTQEMLDAAAPLLRGEIPQDVQDQVYRSSAYKSLMSGTAGSGMSRALTARDLGLTSLGLEQQGAQLATEGGNAAQRWAGLAQGTMLNPSSMLISPQQQAALTMQNNLYKQATKQYQYNVNAMPDPVAKGISDTIMSLVGAYLGGAGGGGMKGGGGGGGQAGVAQYQNFGYPTYQSNIQTDPAAFTGSVSSGGGINLGGYGGAYTDPYAPSSYGYGSNTGFNPYGT